MQIIAVAYCGGPRVAKVMLATALGRQTNLFAVRRDGSVRSMAISDRAACSPARRLPPAAWRDQAGPPAREARLGPNRYARTQPCRSQYPSPRRGPVTL